MVPTIIKTFMSLFHPLDGFEIDDSPDRSGCNLTTLSGKQGYTSTGEVV